MRRLVLFILCPLVLLAQAFDVASIRPSRMQGPRDKSVNPGGIFFSNVTLSDCVEAAWSIKPYQISGGPNWLRSDTYDIVAKAGNADKEQLMLKLRILLAERFKLAVHRETREHAVYLLVTAKNGPKFHITDDGGNESAFVDGGMAFRRMSMPALAEYLSGLSAIERPVLDRTGLSGNFNFTLRLFEDRPGMTGFDKKFAMRDAEHVFTDLQEQLGLKLEPSQAQVEILVIDSVERPSEN
jgi:uncharacterized protein (TIGR03435 family)